MISDAAEKFLPLPIDDTVLAAAYRLKTLGLPWSPQVGCFVWDREAVISVPSPFPKRVYFILSMRRFTDIFGSEEKMRQQLVWVPTWYQAVQLCSRLGVADVGADPFVDGHRLISGEDGFLRLYASIARHLEASKTETPAGKRVDRRSAARRWIRRVMEEELGSLAHLPPDVQRHVQSVYDETGMAYLGWRRIQDRQPEDWVPPETTFDARLLSDLAHFYSDYQKLIQSMAAIREAVKRLRAMDPSKEAESYQGLITDLKASHHRDSGPGRILASLMDPD
ncbi:MAG: hypothetical protein KFF68_18885 [Desulfosarcina sp.]|nr:hypothetical protein [Desulfosarcina sp.]